MYEDDFYDDSNAFLDYSDNDEPSLFFIEDDVENPFEKLKNGDRSFVVQQTTEDIILFKWHVFGLISRPKNLPILISNYLDQEGCINKTSYFDTEDDCNYLYEKYKDGLLIKKISNIKNYQTFLIDENNHITGWITVRKDLLKNKVLFVSCDLHDNITYGCCFGSDIIFKENSDDWSMTTAIETGRNDDTAYIWEPNKVTTKFEGKYYTHFEYSTYNSVDKFYFATLDEMMNHIKNNIENRIANYDNHIEKTKIEN